MYRTPENSDIPERDEPLYLEAEQILGKRYAASRRCTTCSAPEDTWDIRPCTAKMHTAPVYCDHAVDNPYCPHYS
jgi:hypothetical protein